MTVRKSNVELLRIISMAIIVLNHYVSRRGIVETFDVFNFNNNIGHLFRSTGYPALVAFVLISGYFMAGEGKFKTKRIVSVLVQVVAFTLICLMIGVFILHIPVNTDMVVKSLIPYLYGYDAYWFVGPYLGMCLLAPFMDLLMERFNVNQHKLFLIIAIILVFGISTNRNFSMSNERNGILTFVILYAIAGFIKKYKFEETISKSKLLLVMISFWLVSYLTYPIGYFLNIKLFNNMILDMNNMFSLIIGVSFFMLFLKMDVSTNRVINYIAGSTFGVYLFHENFILREWIWGVAVNREAYYSSSLFVVHCFLTVLVLFTIGICFDIIIGYLIKPVLNSAKVNSLCAGADEKINSSFRTAGEV